MMLEKMMVEVGVIEGDDAREKMVEVGVIEGDDAREDDGGGGSD